MENFKLKDGSHKVLTIINKILGNIGLEKDIVSQQVYEDIRCAIEDTDKELVDALLCQLQEINDQMENMSWLNTHYRILHEFAQICSKTLNEEVLFKKAYEMVSQVMPTDSFFIALFNEGDDFINLIFMAENGKFYPQTLIPYGDNYTSKVINTRSITHLKESSPNAEYHVIIGENDTGSCLFVPVIIDDHVKGVISAQSFADFAYRKEHEELLQIIGTQVINSVETARLYEKIYVMSQTDELTGLKNHRAFHEDLSRLISEEKEDITLVMIDSDNLKHINDNYGHDVGDMYLKVLAEGMKSVSTSSDIEGYRYAGDEFMIIINSSNKVGVEDLYERLLSYYNQHPITLANHTITVSISSGVAVYPEHGSMVDSLKKAADDALYNAKKQGRRRLKIAETVTPCMSTFKGIGI